MSKCRKGSGAIRFEDPRLPLDDGRARAPEGAPEALQPFVTVDPRPGLLLLVGKLAAPRGAPGHRPRRAPQHLLQFRLKEEAAS